MTQEPICKPGDSEYTTYQLLRTTLQAAVPLWAIQFREYTWNRLQGMLPDIVDMIASHGDNVLFKSKKQGETAAAFNALAKGLAICSFVPGGVTLFDEHWEFTHPDTVSKTDPVVTRALERLKVLDPLGYERRLRWNKEK